MSKKSSDTKTPVKKAAGKKTATRKPATKRVPLRDNIDALALIRALEQHVLGKTEMTATQVSAALALLKKILPDVVDPARLKAGHKKAARSHEDALDALD